MQTRSKYKGLVEDVKLALIAGEQVKGWAWNLDKSSAKEVWLFSYTYGHEYPYNCFLGKSKGYTHLSHFSVRNPNEKRRIESIFEAKEWLKENYNTILMVNDKVLHQRDYTLDMFDLKDIFVLLSVDIKNGTTEWFPICEMEFSDDN